MPPDRTVSGRNVAAVVVGLIGLVIVAVVGAGSDPAGGARAVLVVGAVAAAAVVAGGTLRARAEIEAAERRWDTARQGLEEEAAALLEALGAREAVLSGMGEGVLLFAPDGRAVYANPAARTLLGRRVDTTTELIPSALRDAVQQARAAGASEVGEPLQLEFEAADATVQATVVPARPARTVLVVARDVTAARRVERLRKDFVANSSHELKTPVASILALSQVLKDAAANDPEAVDRFLRQLEGEAERLARLVGDLLDLSRLEGERTTSEEVRLDAAVEAECERLRQRAQSADVDLSVEPLPIVVVRGSPNDLGLVVHNLLDNAIRYTPAGGHVRVALGVDGGDATLTVDDTGIGIASRDLDRIFERFYRVDPARSRETGGTGLGLSIVRNVVDAHGGDITVRSVLGAGSTFVVRLPLAG